MGFRIISAIFFALGIICLPFWPISRPWPSEASLAICGFCFFFALLTLLISFVGRHGSVIWRGRGHS
jgi:drug/metabolite transporter (DMT)-like permease